MKLIRHLSSLPNQNQACVATIGNFDGLHLGHQKIINNLKAKAQDLRLPLTIISFEPLPAEFFMPKPPSRIYPFRDKVRLLTKFSVDNFVCLKFDQTFSQQSPTAFVEDILLNRLDVKYLAIGDDFKFGHNREGDFDLLVKVGQTAGMEVVKTATLEKFDERVSSTRIRTHLQKGEIKTANKLLGHSYQLSGRVRHGEKRGRTIGFPTLNLKLSENIAPKRGVYAVKVHGLREGFVKGVANLGNRPTVGGSENRLEIHLFDFDEEVYGQTICAELVEFIRPEQRFDNFEVLKSQIIKDTKSASQLLSVK